MDTNKRTRLKTHLDPATNILRFLAVPFGALMVYGATLKLVEVNMAMSFDFWGVFIAGILVTAAPFLMNKFLSAALLGAGIFTVASLLQPNFQSWMNLVFFVLLTVLYFQPYKIWLRIIFQLLCLTVIGVCLWCVWKEFYKGLEHFIETGKLTDVYLKNRIKTFLPGDFSFYMAMVWLVVSLRQYALPKSQQLRNIVRENGNVKNKNTQNSRKHSSSDEDLWGY